LENSVGFPIAPGRWLGKLPRIGHPAINITIHNIMKHSLTILGIAGVSTLVATAGSVSSETIQPAARSGGDWISDIRRPMTNPTLFDLAVPSTNIRPIFIHHLLPDSVNTTAGDLPVDGDVQVYALQFEYAISERFSLVATKDGYVDFNPDATLSDESGFANLGVESNTPSCSIPKPDMP